MKKPAAKNNLLSGSWSKTVQRTLFVLMLTVIAIASLINDSSNVIYSQSSTIPTPPPPPSTVFTIESASQPEGVANNGMDFKLVRSNNLSQVSVTINTSNRNAFAGSDFDKISNQVVTFFPNGGLEKTITVNIKGDTLVEGSEIFEVRLSNPVNAAINGSGVAIGTIENDDKASVTLSVVETTVSEGDSGLTSVTFMATLDNPVSSGFDLEYKTVDGSAEAGLDYEANSGTLSFNGTAGEALPIVVQVKGDTAVEGDETFKVELGSFLNTDKTDFLDTSDSPQEITILDDEVATLRLSSGGAIAEGDSGTTDFIFTVVLSGAVEGGFGVEFMTNDVSATVADNDYVDNDGLLKFEGISGESQTITVQINGDLLGEANELFEVALGAVIDSSVGVEILDSPQPVAILNDDEGVFYLDAGSGVVSEFAESATISVTFSSDLAESVTIDYTTAADSATADEDFTLVSGTLTFEAGDKVKVIQVPILPDFDIEPDETFSVSISNASKFGIGNPSSSVITIQDDDGVSEVSLVSGVIEGSEGESSIPVELVLSQASGATVSVGVKTTNGSAKNGQDYTGVDLTATIAPGETSTIINIPIIGDSIYERNEDLHITLSDPVNATMGSISDALVKIIEDDPIPTVSVSNVSIAESAFDTTTMRFEVTLSSYAAVDIYIDFETSDGEAVAGEDYVANSGRLQIRAGSQSGFVRILVYNDALDEEDETFTLTLTGSSEGELDSGADTVSAIGTIMNTEPAPNGTRSYLPFIAK